MACSFQCSASFSAASLCSSACHTSHHHDHFMPVDSLVTSGSTLRKANAQQYTGRRLSREGADTRLLACNTGWVKGLARCCCWVMKVSSSSIRCCLMAWYFFCSTAYSACAPLTIVYTDMYHQIMSTGTCTA